MYNTSLIHQSKYFTVMVYFCDALGQYAVLSVNLEEIEINIMQFVFLSKYGF